MYHSQLKGTILLLITALIWGAAFVAQSVGMDYIGPFTFSAARDVIAIIVLIPVILLFTDKGTDGTYPPILQQLKPDRITLIGGAWCGLVLGAADTLQQVGISMTTAGKAGFITALYIILVPLMGHFMGRKVPRIIVACVALADFISYASTAISRSLSATSWSSAVPSSSPCTSWSSTISS